MIRRHWVVAAAATVVGAVATTGCATTNPTDNGRPGAAETSGRVLQVAASINAWGSILTQLGGSHVKATSIITNPDTDPHDYEPTPKDGTMIARSQLFVDNGVGYDSWASKTLAASPNDARKVITVGKLVGVPDGGNPHRWYSPGDVKTVANAITADLKALDPGSAAYFDEQNKLFLTTGLATYNKLINEIKTTFAGTAVGASESIFAPLASALNLNLQTPASFLKAISEGSDPTPADLATIKSQIANKKVKVYVYNSQNATPDVTAQVKAAKAAGIPIATVTETLSPANATFQQWQSAQLQALLSALKKATGK